MNLVIDTNVAISGMLWSGPPHILLEWARRSIVNVIVSENTINEFKRVINHKRFADRLKAIQSTLEEIIAYYINLSQFVPDPKNIPMVIPEDPFDNIFLALATEYNTRLVVSGDRHLLNIGKYQGIHIVMPSDACQIIKTLLI